MSELHYESIHLRRIHWAIFSPSLLCYDFNAEYIKDEHHRMAVLRLLAKLDTDSARVDSHFRSLGPMPMGKYFEQLLFFILERDSRYEVLLKNHQIIQNKETIGEIDLIVQHTKTGVIEHWEIALKYYLQSEASPDHNVMLGPSANDNLAKKMKKLKERQLPLTADLSHLGLGDTSTIENKLFLKGQFYYHLNQKDILPENENVHHEKGWWCFLSEVTDMLASNLKWMTIQKPNWIGSISTENDSALHTKTRLLDYLNRQFKEENRSILCIGLQELDGHWIESTRGFVVNDNWPRVIPEKG